LEEKAKSNFDTFGMYKETERAKDFGLWDLAPCELVGDYRSFEGIYSFSLLNRSFILKRGKTSHSENFNPWLFQMRITTINRTRESRLE
jgi:hypothetical protein